MSTLSGFYQFNAGNSADIIAELTAHMTALNKAQHLITKTALDYNKAGEVTAASFVAQDAAGRKYLETLKKVTTEIKNARGKVVDTKTEIFTSKEAVVDEVQLQAEKDKIRKDARDKERAQREQERQIQRELDKKAAIQAIKDRERIAKELPQFLLFSDPKERKAAGISGVVTDKQKLDSFEPEIQRVQAAVIKLRRAIVSVLGENTKDQVRALMSQIDRELEAELKTNKVFSGRTGARGQLEDAIRGLREAQGGLGGGAKAREALDAARQLRQNLLPKFNLFLSDDAKNNISRVDAELSKVQTSASKLGISSARLLSIYKDLGKGLPFALTDAERKILPALTRLSTAHQNLEKSVKTFSSGFVLSWQSIGRLVAIQWLHRIVGETLQLFKFGITEAVDYGNQLVLIQTLTLRTLETTEKWDASIRSLSDTFGGSLKDTALAFYEAVSNQIVETTNSAEIFVTTVKKLAKVTQSSARDAGATLAGVLNSFDINFANADRVAALLFKTVDLGSLNLNDLADRIGRVLPIAKELGLSLEEVLSTIAAFTIEGRKADAAITLLREIQRKLIKPTEDMTKLLKQWGFESGQAAIETLGFTEFLRRFNTVLTSEGVSAVAKYFNELRGLEGIISASGTAFTKIIGNLEEMQNASQDFAKAFDLVMKEPAVRLQNEFERVKNFFIDDLGRNVTTFLAKISEDVGGFANLIKSTFLELKNSALTQFIASTATLVTSLVGLKNELIVLFQLVKVGTEIWIVYKAAVYAAILANRLFLVSSGPLGVAVLAVTAIISAAILVYEQYERHLEDVTTTQKRYIEANRELIQSEIDKKNAIIDAAAAQATALFKSQRGAILGFLADLQVQVDKKLEVINEGWSNLETTIDNVLKQRLDRFREYLQGINKLIEENQKKIKDNQKEILDISTGRDKRNFELSQQGRSDAQQFTANLARLEGLKTSLSNIIDPEQAKATFKEIEDGFDDLIKKQIDRRKELLDKNRVGAASQIANTIGALRAKQLDVEKLRTDQLTAQNKILDEQSAKAKQQLQSDQARFIQIQDLTREVAKLKIVDKGEFSQDKFAQAQTLITKIDSIIKGNAGILPLGQLKELKELRDEIGKDKDEAGRTFDLTKRLKGAALSLNIQKAAVDAQAFGAPLNALREKFGVAGNTVGEFTNNLQAKFKELEKTFDELTGNLKVARTQSIKDKFNVEGALQELTRLKELNPDVTFNKIIDKFKTAQSIQEISALRSSATFSLRDNELTGTTQQAIIESLNRTTDTLIEAMKNRGNEAKAEAAVNAFIAEFGQLKEVNEALHITQKQNTSALEYLTITIKDWINFINKGNGGIQYNTPTAPAQGRLIASNNVNLGGLTVNVTGNNSPQVTARAVVDEINRGVRRGIFKLA